MVCLKKIVFKIHVRENVRENVGENVRESKGESKGEYIHPRPKPKASFFQKQSSAIVFAVSWNKNSKITYSRNTSFEVSESLEVTVFVVLVFVNL
jgi:hypothetical protein